MYPQTINLGIHYEQGLGDKQKWLLSLAYRHEKEYGGDPTPITRLNSAFLSYSNCLDTDTRWSALAKSELFQSRRAVQELVRRGLMEEAGTAIS